MARELLHKDRVVPSSQANDWEWVYEQEKRDNCNNDLPKTVAVQDISAVPLAWLRRVPPSHGNGNNVVALDDDDIILCNHNNMCVETCRCHCPC